MSRQSAGIDRSQSREHLQKNDCCVCRDSPSRKRNMTNNVLSLSCPYLPESGSRPVARKRKTEERAAFVSLKANGNVNEADPLRNREGDEQERTFIQTKSTCFAVSYRAEENGASRDSTVLTVSLDNQPITSVSRIEPMREPLEKCMSIAAESMDNHSATIS